MALQTNNSLVVIGSLVIGGVIGEWIDIEKKLKSFGTWMENKFISGEDGRFTRAFISASLIYCIGAMSITGAIESGIKGNHSILMVKSLIDGTTAIVFATSMGAGVLASQFRCFYIKEQLPWRPVLLRMFFPQPIITEMSATGGLLIVGIGEYSSNKRN